MALTPEQAQERISAESDALKQSRASVNDQMEKLQEEMTQLKAALYLKFGSSINLEKD